MSHMQQLSDTSALNYHHPRPAINTNTNTSVPLVCFLLLPWALPDTNEMYVCMYVQRLSIN